jgi:hypothetical protein
MSEKCRMNRNSVLAIFLVITLSVTVAARADYTYSYTTIDYPGAEGTWANGINNLDWVVGSYSDATGGLSRRFAHIRNVHQRFRLHSGILQDFD